MKKSNKKANKKTEEALTNKRFTANKKRGYKEDVFDAEQQSAYEKSESAKSNKTNTSGPKS